MSESGPSSKGDVRYTLPAGESRVVFQCPDTGLPCEAEVTAIGLNGLDFEIDPAFEIEPGTVISSATVVIGGSVLKGDIRLGRDGDGPGGLFRPASHEIREELSAIVDRLEQVVESQAGDSRATAADTAELRAALQVAKQENVALQAVAGTVAKRLNKTIARLKSALEA